MFQTTATDIDEGPNAEVVYSVDPTSPDFASASDWSINSDGGWSPVIQLDYDSGQRSYEFLIHARGFLDPSKTDSTNVNITILNCNDEAPYYMTGTTLYFSIAEGDYNTPTTVTPTSPLTGLASVLDDDSSGFIFIVLGTSDEFFVVPTAGEILTAVASYDAESKSEYNLTVRVNDTDSPSLYIDVTCVVQVADQNEFEPVCGSSQYIETVAEDTPVGTSVITVTATDADQSQTVGFSIDRQVYINDSNPTAETPANSFTIDANSGLVAVGSALDYEKGTRILLDVCVTDTGSPSTKSSTCSVTLIIIDVNDNAPVWINTRSPNFYTQAYSCDSVDSGLYSIAEVEAIDADADETDFGTVTYEFVDSPDMFELDQVTGMLK